jgi:hypothetical protein
MPKRGAKAAPRPLKRMVAIRRPRKTIVIFCEGEKTEPQYLQALGAVRAGRGCYRSSG